MKLDQAAIQSAVAAAETGEVPVARAIRAYLSAVGLGDTDAGLAFRTLHWERERCAKLVERMWREPISGDKIAAAIRSGEEP